MRGMLEPGRKSAQRSERSPAAPSAMSSAATTPTPPITAPPDAILIALVSTSTPEDARKARRRASGGADAAAAGLALFGCTEGGVARGRSQPPANPRGVGLGEAGGSRLASVRARVCRDAAARKQETGLPDTQRCVLASTPSEPLL